MKELKRTIKIKNDEIYQLRNQLGDKKLHENEFGFDMLCEKYVDDCAMRVMQAIISRQDFDLKPDKIIRDITISYQIAGSMLEEKLKRKKND
jgi:hypothetical protein